ncbi:MAG: hypothetical protein QOG00_3275 [Pyrinomonadaceae bacterium]|nr:hypothetical protein [Pyrinomonadaceae bacterium]
MTDSAPSACLPVDQRRVVSVASRASLNKSLRAAKARGNGLEINDDAKELVQEIGEAINAAVERSPEVADAISRLRAAGYEMELTLKLEIGLRETTADADEEDDAEPETDAQAALLELTDEDRRTLRSMKIRFDESE